MYLKSIEIHGFKSFANKIVFEFPEGITGIVGPNGSGKSNVADAVRWVLGEQKIKQLRGSKMEDVIFAGTSARKPQSYAFVAITFDNSDHTLNIGFDIVTVSRRVFRSGESEYMINGSVCRLRDVQELFYDTGIGKEGYSIIGQGQIDKILQGKPEERREVFDEAAGIVKFKKRKIVSMRKLESERQNLARVNDILSELKRQVGPLKKQSEAAEQFVVYKNELKKYDINLFLRENGDIRTKIRDFEVKEEITRKELEQARTDYENTREEFRKLTDILAETEGKINETRTSLARCDIVRENLKGQINVLNEQIRSALEAQSTFMERVGAMQSQLERSTAERKKLISEKEENQAKLTECIRKSGEKDSYVLDLKNRGEELRQEAEALKEKLVELVNDRGQLTARQERLSAMLEEMARKREELRSTLDRFYSDKADKELELNELEAKQREVSGLVTKAMEDVDTAEKNIKDIEKRIAESEKELALEKEGLIKNKAALESLRNITERYEGYGNTVKEIMKLKDNTPGIRGVVADIIRTEKEYETAIETALGGSIQNVVTDTDVTAKEVIEYLKKNKLGRATFLPLKSITGRGEFKDVEVLDENGVIGIASSLVNVDDEYKGVASFLLGRIVVVDNIDNALMIARKYRFSLILVTLEGELLNRGGSISGGAYKNKSNLLGRRREMDELSAKASAHQVRINELEKEIDAGRKLLRETVAETELLKAKLQEQRIYLNTVDMNLNQAREKALEIENLFKDADIQNKTIDERTSGINDETSDIASLLNENDQDIASVKDKIAAAEKSIEENRDEESGEMIIAQTLKVENSRLTEQNNFLSESILKAEAEIKRVTSEMEILKSSNEDNGQSVASKQQEIIEIQDAVKASEKELADLKERLELLETEKAQKSGSHADFIKKREDLSERTASLDKELFRLTSQKEKLEERFEAKSNYIWEEYQLTFNNALELRDEELTDTRVMRDQISQLKSLIRGLGTINVGAIEEYKEVKERFDFLSEQHEDLVKAEADLVKIIKDLDREMRKQFNSEFKRIKAEFSKVFREMFGGGYGTIELEEDVDVLEAGITIIAQPPGKKLQNMLQLSGGEKALTAIAILFAVQNLKPSPFCILDEIEAALDDSNIIRFAEYLRKLSDEVQFIVITHRKGTMEAADRLYGITMQERGVSSLISVDLTDVEDEQAVS